ncbi:MAG: hypothetical protein K2X06_15540 [Burkholderiales bacterium]|nr:hypothetical protein [Burkholderiales bacterium]
MENRACRPINTTGATHDTPPAKKVQALAQNTLTHCFNYIILLFAGIDIRCKPLFWQPFYGAVPGKLQSGY